MADESPPTKTPELTEAERDALLKLARRALERVVSGGKLDPPEPQGNLAVPMGAFVTLYSPGEQLRGCIGFFQSEHSLQRTVLDATQAAAIRDPRFSPVRMDEVDDLTIDISVLTPPRDIGSLEEIIPGEHGLVISRGYHRGLLLPQVAARRGWDRERFLSETCSKAGLPQNAWLEADTRIRIFKALVFREQKS